MFNLKMYDLYYRFSRPRWDDGAVPQQVVDLASRVRKGRILDLGCGSGTHAIYLAEQGFTVVGVDGSPTALRQARRKAEQAGVNPAFFIQDVTRLDFLQDPFDAGLDVGCFHGLSKAGKEAYCRGLARYTRPGSMMLIWGFDRRNPNFGLTPEQVEQTFAPAFALLRLEPSRLHQRPSHWYWLIRQ
jgi:cyclopropane fatty-acyl-phospholipid synthase-like methyltransferase